MNPGRGIPSVAYRPSRHAHYLVRDTAMEMAHELYDTMMHDDVWYRMWKFQNPGLDPAQLEEAFVNKNMGILLPQARAVLARMLRDTKDPKLEEEIYEALTLDATLIRGRTQ